MIRLVLGKKFTLNAQAFRPSYVSCALRFCPSEVGKFKFCCILLVIHSL